MYLTFTKMILEKVKKTDSGILLLMSVTLEKQGDIDVLRELIEEHFKDKKTLKERFKGHEGEKIKDDPWGDELVE